MNSDLISLLAYNDTAKELSIEEVTDIEDLERLTPEWLAFWRSSTAITIFQSPYWILSWWKYFGRCGSLWVLVARHKEMLVGLAPLYIKASDDAPVGEAYFIGVGITDYLDLIARTGYELSVAYAIFAHIFASDRWCVISLDQLRANSLALRIPTPFDAVVDVQDVCPVLQFTVQHRMAGAIPAAAMRKLNYYYRRLRNIGKIAIHVADSGNFDFLFDALLKLHSGRWQLRGENGMLADTATASFHREAARGLLREGALRLYIMTVDGREAAAFYGFSRNRQTQYYLGGFAPEFKKFNVGTIMIGYAMDQAAREGSTEFDFLRGGEPYKYSWGARDRFNYRRRIHRSPNLLNASAISL